MKGKIRAGLSHGCIVVMIPIEMMVGMLRPRIQFATFEQFTPREKEVLDGICKGLANKEIGNRLNISERTVKFYVSSLFAKVGVKSRRDLEMQFAGATVERRQK